MALGVAAIAIIVCAIIARYVPFTNRVVMIVAALFPYLTTAGPISVALAAIARRHVLASA